MNNPNLPFGLWNGSVQSLSAMDVTLDLVVDREVESNTRNSSVKIAASHSRSPESGGSASTSPDAQFVRRVATSPDARFAGRVATSPDGGHDGDTNSLTFRALRTPATAPQKILENDVIAEGLCLLRDFRKSIIDLTVRISIEQRPDLEKKKRISVIGKSSERFTSWFYDNLAMGNIYFNGVKIVVQSFRTGFRKDFLPENEVTRLINEFFPDRAILDGSSLRRTLSEPSRSNPTSPRSTRSSSDSASSSERLSEIRNDESIILNRPRKITSFYDSNIITCDSDLIMKRAAGQMEFRHPILYQNPSRGSPRSGTDSVSCSHEMYSICNDLYAGREDRGQRNSYLFALLGIYNVLGVDNNYLAIPGGVVRKFQMELFGSPFNTARAYFSPFWFLEQFFGSRGGFFTHTLPDEFSMFTYNPPFSESVMKLAAIRLVSELHRRTIESRHATVFATLPVWDSESQRKIGAPDFHTEFEGWEHLRDSGFVREHEIWVKQVEFFDKVKQCMVPTVNLHLIILSTMKRPPVTIAEIKEAWHR